MFKNLSFKKYLDNTNNFTLNLAMRHFNFDDSSECICSIIDFINVEIIKLRDINNKKYIFKAFKILNNPSNYKEIDDFNEIELCLNKLEENVKICLMDSDDEFSSLFDIVLDNIQLLKKQLDFSSKIVEDERNLEDFAEKIIFEIRNIDLCIELFKTYPDIINSKDSSNTLLVDKIVDKYIESLKGNSAYFLSYYDAVINALFINSHHKLNDEIANKVTQSLKSYKLDNDDKTQLFLERVVANIKDTYVFDNHEDVSNIYNINLTEPEFSINPIIKKDYEEVKDKCIITMDGQYTRIRDDAFSVTKLKNGNYLLEIYAANVSSYVLPKTDLDKRARMMGKTIWTNLGTVNMLPSSLSQDVLSLTVGKDRRCICYSFEFTRNLELVNFNLKKVLINPTYNISYDEFNNVSKDNMDLYNSLSLARVFLELSEYNNTYINEYHALKTIRRQILNVNNKNRDINTSNSGEKLINIFKLLLGNYVSKQVFNLGLPFVYRVNNANVDKNIVDLKNRYTDTKDSKAILNVINNCLGKSYYSISNIGHKGLGLDSYSNVSISIRNYISLVCERLICKYFIDKEKLNDKSLVCLEKYLIRLVEEINLRMHLNDDYVLELNRIKKRT